jgi:hypothetical protein
MIALNIDVTMPSKSSEELQNISFFKFLWQYGLEFFGREIVDFWDK